MNLDYSQFNTKLIKEVKKVINDTLEQNKHNPKVKAFIEEINKRDTKSRNLVGRTPRDKLGLKLITVASDYLFDFVMYAFDDAGLFLPLPTSDNLTKSELNDRNFDIRRDVLRLVTVVLEQVTELEEEGNFQLTIEPDLPVSRLDENGKKTLAYFIPHYPTLIEDGPVPSNISDLEVYNWPDYILRRFRVVVDPEPITQVQTEREILPDDTIREIKEVHELRKVEITYLPRMRSFNAKIDVTLIPEQQSLAPVIFSLPPKYYEYLALAQNKEKLIDLYLSRNKLKFVLPYLTWDSRGTQINDSLGDVKQPPREPVTAENGLFEGKEKYLAEVLNPNKEDEMSNVQLTEKEVTLPDGTKEIQVVQSKVK